MNQQTRLQLTQACDKGTSLFIRVFVGRAEVTTMGGTVGEALRVSGDKGLITFQRMINGTGIQVSSTQIDLHDERQSVEITTVSDTTFITVRHP